MVRLTLAVEELEVDSFDEEWDDSEAGERGAGSGVSTVSTGTGGGAHERAGACAVGGA